jgi:hypothetical protein
MKVVILIIQISKEFLNLVIKVILKRNLNISRVGKTNRQNIKDLIYFHQVLEVFLVKIYLLLWLDLEMMEQVIFLKKHKLLLGLGLILK